MFTFFPPIAQDMAGLLLLWGLSGLGLIVLAGMAIGRSQRVSLGQLLRGEQGGAYSISLLMMLPTFITLLALFVECNSLMLGKIGSIYAAFAATRSAVVWLPIDEQAQDASRRLSDRCHFAAAKALAPFASGKQQHGPVDVDSLVAQRAEDFAAAYEGHSGDDANRSGYLQQKFINAFYATDVNVETAPVTGAANLWNVAVTVNYRAPLHTPGIGRLLGASDLTGNFYSWPFSASLVMAAERPLLSHTISAAYALGVRHGEDR